MKAKVIKTGEIVNVIPEQGGWCDTDFKSYSRHYDDKELDYEFRDWSSFRREAAKDILCAMVSTTNVANPEDVTTAIEIADELVKQLKEESHD